MEGPHSSLRPPPQANDRMSPSSAFSSPTPSPQSVPGQIQAGSPKGSIERVELDVYPPFASVVGGIRLTSIMTTPKCVSTSRWVKDGDVTKCKGCSVEFSFVVRKHHCRTCGKIYCHNCSGKTLPVAQDNTTVDIRVCDCCHAEHLHPVVRSHTERQRGYSKRGKLNALPTRLLYRVLQYLPIACILRASTACRNLYFVARDNVLWKNLYQRRWMGGERVPAVTLRHSFHFYHGYQHKLEAERKMIFKRVTKWLSEFMTQGPIKIALIGPPAIGKTALANYFITGIPHPCGWETSGATVRTKRIQPYSTPPPRLAYDPILLSPCSVQIIDCGGHSRYRSLWPIFLSGVHAVIICFDIADKVSLIEAAEMAEQEADKLCSRDAVFIACGIHRPPPQRSRRPASPGVRVHQPSTDGKEASLSSSSSPSPSPRALELLESDSAIVAGGSPPPTPADLGQARCIHHRVRAAVEADPYTGRGVQGVFATCLQLLVDGITRNKSPPSPAAQTPLDCLYPSPPVY